jgi:hypothetical protein
MRAALNPGIIPVEIAFGLLFVVCMLWPGRRK